MINVEILHEKHHTKRWSVRISESYDIFQDSDDVPECISVCYKNTEIVIRGRRFEDLKVNAIKSVEMLMSKGYSSNKNLAYEVEKAFNKFAKDNPKKILEV